MRKLLMLLATLVATTTIYAQDKLDAFGKVNKADLEMKVCDFDPDAEAECLFDLGEVYYSISSISVDIQANFRKRIKILKEKGIDRANIKIRYYSKDGYEDISKIEGIVYNLDNAGNIVTTRLEKSQIYDKKIDSRYSEISFALPNVKVGSIVEYKYRSFKKDNIEDIADWDFQSDIPVKYSSYNLLIPEYFDFTYKINRRQPVEQFTSKREGEGQYFIMRNIPGLKYEPYMAGYRDYIQRVDFQLSGINPPGRAPISLRTTWEKLIEELLDAEWFGKQANKNVPGTSGPLKLLLSGATTDAKKIDIIYKFVQSNMSWNGRTSIGSYEGVKDAWDKKSGNLGDINLLLLNLLKDNHITASPLLISTRDNGRINTVLPFLGQFDGVYVYAEADGKTYVLNAADKYNPSDTYPYDVQFTDALIVSKKGNRFLMIKDQDKKLKHTVSLFISVDEQGAVAGNATVNSYEYGKNIRRKTYKTGKLNEVFNENEGIKLTMDSVVVNNEANDSLPLEQRLYFTGNIQQQGEYGFLPYNLFSGLAKNPFVADKRESAIDFGYNQSYVISGAYNIADNYEFDELPKNIKMILPDSSISLTRIVQKNDQMVNFRVTIDFLRSEYDAEEYPDVKEVYKKVFELLNEHIVIKKKK